MGSAMEVLCEALHRRHVSGARMGGSMQAVHASAAVPWRQDMEGPNRDGQNMLGKLWMEVRAELRSAAVSPDAPAK